MDESNSYELSRVYSGPPPVYSRHSKAEEVEEAVHTNVPRLIDTLGRWMTAQTQILTIYGISITMLWLYYYSILGCSKGPFSCFPQLVFLIKDDSESSKTIVSALQETLKMVSFLAKDFGTSPSTPPMMKPGTVGESVSSYNFDHNELLIDTFSPVNVYDFNIFGFCRYNKKSRTEVCHNGNLNIFSCWMMDIGTQLGEISKKDPTDSKILGDSFVTAYESVLRTISSLQADPTLGFDDKYLQIALRLNFANTFAYIMKCLSISVIVFSVAIFLLSICLFATSPDSTDGSEVGTKSYLHALIGLQIFLILQVIFTFSTLAGVLSYFHLIDKAVSSLGIANIGLGGGFWMLLFNFGLLIFMQIILVFLLLKTRCGRK